MHKRRAIGRLGWRLGIGVLLLGWIFHSIFLLEGRRAWEHRGFSWEELSRFQQWHVGWSYGPLELWHTLTLVSGSGMLLSILFMGLTIFVGMVRWRFVLSAQGLNLSLGRTAEISLVAHFFNSFLLGSSGGDLLKAYYAARETHHKKTEAVTTVLVDRLVGLFAMLVFAGLMMLPNLDLLSRHPSLAALAWFIVLMMAGCAGVLTLSFWGGLSRSWPTARLWLRKLPRGDLAERALDTARQFGKRPLFLLRMFVLSMILNVFCVLQIWALAWGMDLSVSLTALFVIVPIIVCVSALPITPSGLGVRENLYVMMLGVKEINVEATAALSLSLLAYAGFLLWSIIGGIVYLMRKSRDHLDEIAKGESLPEQL